jgi:hypothetical protein
VLKLPLYYGIYDKNLGVGVGWSLESLKQEQTPGSLADIEMVLRIHNHGSQELNCLIMVYNHTSQFLDKKIQIIGHKLPVQIANSFMKTSVSLRSLK